MKLICKKHRKYRAIRQPQSTHKHPDGCQECWKVWKQHNK